MYRRSPFSVGVLAGVMLVAISLSQTASAELVAYYNFDEASGTALQNEGSAGSALNGVVSGGSWVAGKYGNGLYLNGTSDYATIADNPALNFTSGQSFTTMFWVKIDPSQPDGWHAIYSKGRDVGGSTFHGAWYHKDGATNSIVTGPLDSANNKVSADITSGSWMHVAEVFDATNSQFQLYLNGNSVATFNGKGDHTTVGSPLYIGAWLSTKGGFNEGGTEVVDEFRIYNTALTQSEIHNASSTPEPSTMVLTAIGVLGLLAYAWRKRK